MFVAGYAVQVHLWLQCLYPWCLLELCLADNSAKVGLIALFDVTDAAGEILFLQLVSSLIARVESSCCD